MLRTLSDIEDAFEKFEDFAKIYPEWLKQGYVGCDVRQNAEP
jgi:hypothetical protein